MALCKRVIQCNKHLNALAVKYFLTSVRAIHNPVKLVEVGKFTDPQTKDYETGQLFFHRIFGYRGVILFPWTARFYDRDLNKKQSIMATEDSRTNMLMPTGTKSDSKLNQAWSMLKTIASSSKSKKSSCKSSTSPSEAKSADKESEIPPPSTREKPRCRGPISRISEATAKLEAIKAHSGRMATNPFEMKDSGPVRMSDCQLPSDFGIMRPSAYYAKDLRDHTKTYYHVLIDVRDWEHIRVQTEGVTFLGSQENNNLYTIPGLDHVCHDDILPYTSKEKHPIQHELFDKFLSYAPHVQPNFIAQDALNAWRAQNFYWLDMGDVHRETTENIRVTVIPFYLGVRRTPLLSTYWWRYSIRLENFGAANVQLRERHWRIFSLSGTLETVRGHGVIGQEPVLSLQHPAFQYSSHISLHSPSGHMWGTFQMLREDGYKFECKVPSFPLESRPERGKIRPLPPSTSNNGY